MKKNILLYDIDNQFNVKSKKLKFIIYFCIVLLIGISLWISQEKISRLLDSGSFYDIRSKFEQIEKKVFQNGWDSVSVQEIQEIQESIKQLKEYEQLDNPMIFFYSGKASFFQFRKQIISPNQEVINFLFSIYINKNPNLKFECKTCLEIAKVKIQKAQSLKISLLYSQEISQLLNNIYFWSGIHYYPYVGSMLKTIYSKEILLNAIVTDDPNNNKILFDNIILHDIYSILYTKHQPSWSNLANIFTPIEIEFFKIMYYLSNKRIVLGIQMLQDLEKRIGVPKNDLEFWLYQYSMYLQGFEFGKRKRYYKQYNAYLHINKKTFIQIYPWFQEEFHYIEQITKK